MKKLIILATAIVFTAVSILMAAEMIKGTVEGVKDTKVLIEVGKDAKKLKKGDKVEIKIEGGEALVPKLQGC
ncbi:hypothetical protein DSN97_01840 [Deferribacteraceae bacterium V6Fe1]|nr:hypothetical protein DSN97_01840 [Deferribacteraceae bacterium V6Fe1]